MKKYGNTTALSEGHSDSRASDDGNMALSQKLAQAVERLLVDSYGIAAERLKSIAYDGVVIY